MVGTVRYLEVTDPGVAIYLPLAQDPQRNVAVAVRTAAEPLRIAAQVRETLRAALPDQPLSDLMPMTQVVDENTLLAARYSAGVLGKRPGRSPCSSAQWGMHGVVSQWVLQRVRELGIRAALGARRGQLLGLVLSRGLTPVGIGAALGLRYPRARARSGPSRSALRDLAGRSGDAPRGSRNGGGGGHGGLSAARPSRGEDGPGGGSPGAK